MRYTIKKRSSFVLAVCIFAYSIQLFSLVNTPFSVVNTPIALFSLLFACLFLYIYDNQKKTAPWIIGSVLAFTLYLPRFLASSYLAFIYYPFFFENPADTAYFENGVIEILPAMNACFSLQSCSLWMQNNFTETIKAFSQGLPPPSDFYSSMFIVLLGNILLVVLGGAILGMVASIAWKYSLSKYISLQWPYLKVQKKSTIVLLIAVVAFNLPLFQNIHQPFVWLIILAVYLFMSLYDRWRKSASGAIGSLFAVIVFLPRLFESFFISFIYLPFIFDSTSNEARSGAEAFIVSGALEGLPTSKICVEWNPCFFWMKNSLLESMKQLSEGSYLVYYKFWAMSFLANVFLIALGGALIGTIAIFVWNRFLAKPFLSLLKKMLTRIRSSD